MFEKEKVFAGKKELALNGFISILIMGAIIGAW